jgi:predicted membrane protein
MMNMKMPNMKSMMMKNPLEMVLLVLFIIYLVFPVNTPAFLAPMVDSSLGMVGIFAVVLFLFIYSHPLLAILYIFVAYELIRRSTQVTGKSAYIQFTPSEEKRNANMQAMNPPKEESLEEAVVSQMAPVPHTSADFLETEFKPLAEDVHHASII